jgi:imidazole glycerol-phosphate synthase subunit HisF
MLKRRIIPIELLWSNRLVKTRAFDSPRDVGDPVKSSKVYSDQDADELVLLQIDRDDRRPEQLVDAVRRIAKHCFIPFTVGGGITNIEDAASLFEAGADKVLLNSVTYRHPKVISAIAERYGRQAVVVGIDVLAVGRDYIVYSDRGRQSEAVSLEAHIAAVVAAGAGELLVQSIKCDGVMEGYDLALIKRVIACSPIPVIVAGGAGHFLHLKEAFEAGADATACGSLFNFGDNSPLRAKAFLKNHGIALKRI